MSNPNASEKETIERALHKDQDALEELLLLRYDWLKSVAAKTIPAYFSAKIQPEEVVQEAFVKILRRFEAFHPESEAGMFAWLRVIVQNTAKDMLRKASRSLEVNEAERAANRSDESVSEFVASLAIASDPTASVVARERELHQAFQLTMQKLDPKYRKIIELLYFQDYSVERAAIELGVTQDAVRGLRQRARQQIKDGIAQLSHFV